MSNTETESIQNMTPSVLVTEDNHVYEPRELKRQENRRKTSSGALSKVMLIETKEVQDYLADGYEQLNKSLAEVFRNTKNVAHIKVKEQKSKGGGTKQIASNEERNRIKDAILGLNEKFEVELEKSSAKAQAALSEGEEYVMTHPKHIRLMITTPEARLFSYIIEVADAIIKNYSLAWIGMEIDDKEKNDSISRIIGELKRVSQLVKSRARNFYSARLEKQAGVARKKQKYEMKSQQKRIAAQADKKESDSKEPDKEMEAVKEAS